MRATLALGRPPTHAAVVAAHGDVGACQVEDPTVDKRHQSSMRNRFIAWASPARALSPEKSGATLPQLMKA